MSDFHNPMTAPVARKPYRCIYCYGPIAKGETHAHQTGRYDGAWYDHRFHNECWESLTDDVDPEFIPGCGDVPDRVRAAMEAVK